MKCSHGLAYEVRCADCVREALDRMKNEPVKKPVPLGTVAGPYRLEGRERLIAVDSIQSIR